VVRLVVEVDRIATIYFLKALEELVESMSSHWHRPSAWAEQSEIRRGQAIGACPL